MTPSPDMPTDTPLLRVLRSLEASGHTGQFRAVEGGDVECLTCHATTPATDVEADDVTRLEGASDPADMLMVVPLRCPACQTLGTLVVGYGPESSPEDSDVLVALERDDPSEGDDR
jgi:hypothetical protein